MAKITGKEGLRFNGPARVCAIPRKRCSPRSKGLEIHKGERGGYPLRGAKGRAGNARDAHAHVGPGRRRPGGADVALLTDGRFSGGSHGFIVGHITPEAQDGGPIALVKDGDPVTINIPAHRIDVEMGDQEWADRRAPAGPRRSPRPLGARYPSTSRRSSRLRKAA